MLRVTTPLALTLARFYRRVPLPPGEFSWVSRHDPWQDVIEFAATSPRGRRRFRDEDRRGERPRVMRKSQSPRRCPGEKFSLRCISGTSSRGNSPEHLVAPGIAFISYPSTSPLIPVYSRNESGIVSDCNPSINRRETRATLFSLLSIAAYNKIIIISRAFKSGCCTQFYIYRLLCRRLTLAEITADCVRFVCITESCHTARNYVTCVRC